MKLEIGKASKIILSRDRIQDAIESIERWYEVRLTPRQVLFLLKEMCPSAAASIASGRGKGLDTADREDLIEELAYKITRKPWPTNSTPEAETLRFYKEFSRKAKKKGIRLSENFDARTY